MNIYKAKDAYLRMISEVEAFYVVLCNTASTDEVTEFEKDYYAPAISAYFDGSYSIADAEKILEDMHNNEYYRRHFGEEPELVEDEYICTTPYHRSEEHTSELQSRI